MELFVECLALAVPIVGVFLLVAWTAGIFD